MLFGVCFIQSCSHEKKVLIWFAFHKCNVCERREQCSTTATTADATPAPSDKEIADAKAKGMVWVNLSSKIYHKEGKFYGKTKRGKFMSEDDAQKAGYREAKTETASKTNVKAAPTTKK